MGNNLEERTYTCTQTRRTEQTVCLHLLSRRSQKWCQASCRGKSHKERALANIIVAEGVPDLCLHLSLSPIALSRPPPPSFAVSETSRLRAKNAMCNLFSSACIYWCIMNEYRVGGVGFFCSSGFFKFSPGRLKFSGKEMQSPAFASSLKWMICFCREQTSPCMYRLFVWKIRCRSNMPDNKRVGQQHLCLWPGVISASD